MLYSFSSIILSLYMRGFLFVQNLDQAQYLSKAFQRENLSLEIVPFPFSYEQFHDADDRVFVFTQTPDTPLLQFLQFLKHERKQAVTVFLSEDVPVSSQHFDFVFFRPFSYRFIAFQVQQKFFQKQAAFGKNQIDIEETTLDFFTHEVCHSPYRVPLRNKEFSLLQLFMLNPGRVFSRYDLLELIWDRFMAVSTNTVDVHVSRLRRKLKKCDSPLAIKTISGIGYALMNA